jgi:catechol 2,3-dioxygenase-like lactoylglutathione lyase family enzyme
MPHPQNLAPRIVAGHAAPPAKLAHVVLRSRRYQEAVAWWSTVLAARVVFSNAFLTFMTYDDEHHRVALINAGAEAADPSPGVGMDHVAFTYASLGELLAAYVRLRDAGIMPVWTINHGATTSFYYRDPDGLQAELQIDNFADEAGLRAWFATGAFAQNPIGVEFDPEILLRKYEAGVPEAELIKQGSASV